MPGNGGEGRMASRIKGITVEIGGDTTKLTDSLKDVNGEIKHTQAQLKDVEKLLKFDPSNTELLAQRQRLLSQELAATKEKLEALKVASEQANAALEAGTITKDQYDALQREIIETENALEDLEKQAGESAVALQKISKAGDSLQETGDKITDVGKKMSVVSAGVVATGTASAKMAMGFEDAMAKVSTIADTTQVPLAELEKRILALSNETGISSSEIANNVYDAISAGQSTGDAVNFVTNSTKLAKAGFADAGAALDVLTTILNAYGLEADKVTDVSDMLIQTQNLGKTTVAQLASSMGKIIPTANAYNVQLDQLCAGYAVMTANGVATAETTTYMNSMLNELGKSGTGVSNILKEKTGSSFMELMANGYSLADCLAIIGEAAAEQGLSFGDMWSSSEAAKAGLILLGDSAESFNGTLANMQNSTGATDTAFEKLKTNSYTIQVAINQLKNTAIELGSAIMSVLAPILISLAEKISALTTWFAGLSDGTKKTIVIIGMIVAAIGPVLVVVGKVISAVGTVMTILPKLAGILNVVKGAFALLNTTMLANPIMLIIAAIAALVAAFVYLWNNCEGFRQFWIDLWEKIKEATSKAFSAISNGIKDTVSKIGESIKNGFNNAVEFITGLASSAYTWGSDIIGGIVDGIRSCISKVKEAVTDVAETIRAFLHFSVPDEGPLTDYESWMPDFMGGLAKGIEQSRGMIAKAVKGVASDMVIRPGIETVEVAGAGGIPYGGTAEMLSGITGAVTEALSRMSGQERGDIVIPIYLGGTMLDEVIVNAQQRMNLRSGGR